MRLCATLCTYFLFCSFANALNPRWPTTNTAFDNGLALEAYIQPVPGKCTESGCYGCFRSSGYRFHEGADIKTIQRDRHGEPLDAVSAILDGVVVHINRVPGRSNYGHYVVLYHTCGDMALYSLYAHLKVVDGSIKIGQCVKAGQVLGQMGRTSAGYKIPLEQAHVHLEIGVQLNTCAFDKWYKKQNFATPNYHGAWNGMNLSGIDPLDFFKWCRKDTQAEVIHYFKAQPIAFTVRTNKTYVPSYVRKNPGVLTCQLPQQIFGWDIAFNKYGIPVRWTPLTTPYVGKATYTLEVQNGADLEGSYGCKMVGKDRRGRWMMRQKLQQTLDILFTL